MVATQNTSDNHGLLEQNTSNHGHHEDPGPGLLFTLESDSYISMFLFVAFMCGIVVLLLVFNETLLHTVTQKLPESVILILMGIVAAALAKAVGQFDEIVSYIKADVFFNFLLPPIILDSAYQLYCKQFLYNLDGILLLALVGTTLNIFANLKCVLPVVTKRRKVASGSQAKVSISFKHKIKRLL